MDWLAFALILSLVATFVAWRAFGVSPGYSRAEIVWLIATIVLVLSDAALVGLVI